MRGHAYYNEHDPYCADWLRNLVAAGHIAPGDVDGRDIRDVRPAELAGYVQAHFFAGIGLWSLALRWAGWPDDRAVWTGSCPCQPFSGAGRGDGFADPRHLWPEWFRLIRECRPVALAGEQVAGPHALVWLDAVFADLEGSGYACGAVDFPSAGVGAPNIRQRLWWVGNAINARLERHGRDGTHGHEPGREHAAPDRSASPPDDASGPWCQPEWVDCLDGRRRPFEPGSFPLAARHPGDVGRLRAYGNAINPVVAAAVIRAWME